MGAVVSKRLGWIFSVVACLISFGVKSQSIIANPSSTVYCDASGQIEFSLNYTPVDGAKVFWSENGSFTSFAPGIGEVDTLTWAGNSSIQTVKVFVVDSSATPVLEDSLTLNFAVPPIIRLFLSEVFR